MVSVFSLSDCSSSRERYALKTKNTTTLYNTYLQLLLSVNAKRNVQDNADEKNFEAKHAVRFKPWTDLETPCQGQLYVDKCGYILYHNNTI